MGLAASQARLLALTARIHDVEYQAQQIQNAKLQLALTEDSVYQKYMDALDAETLTYNVNGKPIKATFNNLFGKGSIENGLNKNYILRTNDDKVVVPDEIFEAWEEFGGDTNAYAFAMYLAGNVNFDDVNNAEENYLEVNKDNDAISSYYKERDESRSSLESYLQSNFKVKLSDIGNYPHICWEDVVQQGGGISADDAELKELVEDYIAKDTALMQNIYCNGAQRDAIFHSIKGVHDNETINNDEFQYYLRYAKIMEDVGPYGIVSESDYEGYSLNDSDNLDDMLKSGKLCFDIVSIDKATGKVVYDPTSTNTDNNVSSTQKSSVDSNEVKKAEAEYENEMRKINRKDKQYDLDLNKLETERTALTTEYDSVKKVIQDNIDRTFKIFS